MIVLPTGKKIFPEEIEAKLNKIKGVEESFVFEDNNKINAKIVFDVKFFEDKTNNEIYDSIMKNIKILNETLPQYKKVTNIIITSEKLEKTAIGKIKRNKENEKIKIDNTQNIVTSNDNSTYEKIINILIKQLGNKKIREETDIILDLGADSLDMVEIVLEVEKKFNIKIEKEQRKRIAKVRDLLKIVEKK